MILTRHFVYVHVPKTGGNFVRAVIDRNAPPEWDIVRLGDHATVHDIPATHRALPRLAFVRNPFSWYVSWFAFQQETKDPYFLEVSDGGRLPFAPAMRRAFAENPALRLGEGPFTQTLKEMLGEGLEGVRCGKMESLRDDLRRLLAECCAIPPAMNAAIDALPRLNTSTHDHYSRYYDAELRALIEQKDAIALQFFGYRFETP